MLLIKTKNFRVNVSVCPCAAVYLNSAPFLYLYSNYGVESNANNRLKGKISSSFIGALPRDSRYDVSRMDLWIEYWPTACQPVVKGV
jgi:hypothetical protein